MEFISGGSFIKQQFLQANVNCYKAWNHMQKTSDLPLNTKIIKQAHKIMMDGEDILVGE